MNFDSNLPQSGYVTPTWLKNYLQISNSTMHSWIASGWLPRPHRVGVRAVRFRAEDIRRFEQDRIAHGVKLAES